MTPATPDIQTIDNPAAAAAVIHPLRRELLGHLQEPNSASGLADVVSLPRQKINYHLRELERAGLVELVEERRRGNCTERIVKATARYYLIDPSALGALDADPDALRYRFSSSYLLALGARMVREIAWLRTKAQEKNKRLPTFSLSTEVRFASAADQNAFAEELSDTVTRLVKKYHDGDAPRGRTFRFMTTGYPKPKKPTGGKR